MITATLNGIAMPPIEQKFLKRPLENATDVVTLDGNMYTDFISLNEAWEFNYVIMTEAEYDLIKAAYEAQFTTYEYPLLSIPFFGITDQPARMSINEQDIWNNCGDVQNVQIQFRLTDQIDGGSS